ncbi:MAG: hypothetical protein ACRENO_05770, partial [Thermodesulfobacteriota bacterium]
IYSEKVKSDLIFMNDIKKTDKNFMEFIKIAKPEFIILNKMTKSFLTDRLENTELFITSIDGMITAYTDGENLEISRHNF